MLKNTVNLSLIRLNLYRSLTAISLYFFVGTNDIKAVQYAYVTSKYIYYVDDFKCIKMFICKSITCQKLT